MKKKDRLCRSRTRQEFGNSSKSPEFLRIRVRDEKPYSNKSGSAHWSNRMTLPVVFVNASRPLSRFLALFVLLDCCCALAAPPHGA
jgi:hypothetical protein